MAQERGFGQAYGGHEIPSNQTERNEKDAMHILENQAR